MTTCARCNGELPRSRVHVDGKEYHLECHRTEADWRELDRLAEIAMQGLCFQSFQHVQPSPFTHAVTETTSPFQHTLSAGYFSKKSGTEISTEAYAIAEAMLAERKRRRET